MCGRFTVRVAGSSVAAAYGVTETVRDSRPSYNVAPGQTVPVVLVRDGRRVLDGFRWGLVPHWADDPSIGNRLINARAETVDEKPAFRRAFALRRCLILSDGFYEWKADARGKRPHHITLEDGGVFPFAGIWERWEPRGGGEPLLTCAIVTVEASPFMAAIHARMPAILSAADVDAWLDPSPPDASHLKALLRPYAGNLRAVPVSTFVNVPRNDAPECVLPFGTDEP